MAIYFPKGANLNINNIINYYIMLTLKFTIKYEITKIYEMYIIYNLI